MMEAIVFYFLMQQIYQFKAKSSEINKYPLRLGNILGDFLANNMKKAGLKDVLNILLNIKLLILVIVSISINI